MERVTLILEDGTRFVGGRFGANHDVEGEVVFQTGMVGYVESLTDPSYHTQILVLTYPMIGNYGVPGDDREPLEKELLRWYESSKVWPVGLVVGECSEQYSHWNASKSLDQWLMEQNVTGISGIDTRALTMKLRSSGTMAGKIVRGESIPTSLNFPTISGKNLVAEVSTKALSKVMNPSGKLKILVIDCGLKYNQLRCFLARNVAVQVAPWDSDLLSLMPAFDGLFISNGPGDPALCRTLISNLSQYMKLPDMKPVFGICMGHQIVGLAAGLTARKMPFGHRGHNQPARLCGTNRCYITSQNHGYELDASSLPNGWQELFQNANDDTNEGLICVNKPVFSVQFHPEHAAGPRDLECLFDVFLDGVRSFKAKTPFDLKEMILDQLAPSRGKELSQPKPRKVLLLGSGGLSIGQAGEFDYSGSQALKALQEEGINTVLINPNIATVQTSKNLATTVYFLPITLHYVTQVIELERPDGILLNFGGQTALNCGIDLHKSNVLSDYGVRVLGTPVQVIINTEDRKIFAEKMQEVGYKVAPSGSAETVVEAVAAAAEIGYPVLIRAAFALGGLGSGFAKDAREVETLAKKAFTVSPQILIDKSLSGWKEVEYEVVRDIHDNCITVCNMENVDPLGIHTGESVVVAPSQTLSNDEYNLLRTAAIRIIRHLGVVGECNVQYALDPKSLEFYVVEVNARLSRSSALASKATGYPLAYIAAKLSIGQSLVELRNSVTKKTTACFEPSLDYCVVKMPRWDLNKFDKVNTKIGSSMKSIGEVMAIGRNFEEAFQKAFRMVDEHLNGFDPYREEVSEEDLRHPTDKRMLTLATALAQGKHSLDVLHDWTRIDKWFLQRMNNIIQMNISLTKIGEVRSFKLDDLGSDLLLKAKRLGFSDKQIAVCIKNEERAVRAHRRRLRLHPWVKQIDTLSGEWPAETNYLYLTYHGEQHDVVYPIESAQQVVIVLGSGVYRIGSSVEFDCCAVGCLDELRRQDRASVMINCNPETVSTDYDKCDRLYFEEISFESVMEIYELEQPEGIILSMGGQLPNNIAMDLDREKVKVLGTTASSIDNAENRFKFSRLLDDLKIRQPAWKYCPDLETAFEFGQQVGYPCLVRPSYVLSGAAMNVAYSRQEITGYLQIAAKVSKDQPIVVSKFIQEAKEIDVDAVAANGDIVCMAVSEHVENAGVHSGDATLVTPPQDLTEQTLIRIGDIVKKLGKGLHVNGPFNLQLIAKDDNLQVIEVNLRCSRSLPFVMKTLDHDFVGVATRIALGLKVQREDSFWIKHANWERVGVKVPMFSFSRLPEADVSLGVEMSSTGEVACFGKERQVAFLKAMMSASGFRYPEAKKGGSDGVYLSVGSLAHKEELLPAVHLLQKMDFRLAASEGTAYFYQEQGIKIESLQWPPKADNEEGRRGSLLPPTSELKAFDLVINIPTQKSGARRASSILIPAEVADASDGLTQGGTGRRSSLLILTSKLATQLREDSTQGYRTRRTAVDFSTPLITDIKVAKLLIESIYNHRSPPPVSRSLDSITSRRIVYLPGLIDVHVHLRDPGATHKEDFASGTAAALAGGITMVCAMPNTNPSVVDENSLKVAQNAAKKNALCDYALFVGASADNAKTVGKLAKKAAALKMYLNCTFSTLELSDMSLWKDHFVNWPKTRPICVHAEGHTLAAVLLFAHLYGRHVHFCHVSRRDEILLIKEAKEKGMEVTCEVTPHHLFLTEDDVPEDLRSVKPALGSKKDQEALWENMDVIDCFATDHAPHLPEEKKGKGSPPGFPGLETMLPLLLNAVNEGRLTLDDVKVKLHDNPKRIFGLPDQWNTSVEIDMDEGWVIPEETKFSKAKWTPFAGMPIRGKVQRVTLRGVDVFVNGDVLVEPGFGKDVRNEAEYKNEYLSGEKGQKARFELPTVRLESEAGDAPMVDGLSYGVSSNGLTNGLPLDVSNHNLLGKPDVSGQATYGKPQETFKRSASADKKRLRRISIDLFPTIIVEEPQLPLRSLTPSGQHSFPFHIVSVEQFKKLDVDRIYEEAHNFKLMHNRGDDLTGRLRGKIMASMFFEPSTRTSVSFAVAMLRLGGTVKDHHEASSSSQKGESLEDTVTMYSIMTDVLVMRHPEPHSSQRASKQCSKPFINAGDGTGEHPTQALLDVFTIRDEIGTVKGLTISMVGDLKNGRTVHSLAKLLTLHRVKEIRYLSPPGLGMPEDVKKYVAARGVVQKEYQTLEQTLPDTDVLYMTRIQKERFKSTAEYEAACGKFVLTAKVMTFAREEKREAPKMRVLHPLPRCGEILEEVDEDPRAAYFRQAENGVYVRMALLWLMLKPKDADRA